MIVSFIRFFLDVDSKNWLKSGVPSGMFGFFCYNHNGPLVLTCLTWTKFHPMGILLGFTKGKLFVDEFISPGRNWGPLVKRFGKPGWKERGKVLTNRNCEMFLASNSFPNLPKKNTGSCFLLQPQDSKQLSPQTSPPHFVARSYETSKQYLTKSTAIPRHSMYGTFTLHSK